MCELCQNLMHARGGDCVFVFAICEGGRKREVCVSKGLGSVCVCVFVLHFKRESRDTDILA